MDRVGGDWVGFLPRLAAAWQKVREKCGLTPCHHATHRFAWVLGGESNFGKRWNRSRAKPYEAELPDSRDSPQFRIW